MTGFFGDTVGIEFVTWGIYHWIPLFLVVTGVIVIYLLKDKIKASGYDKRIRYTLGTLGIISELSLHLWIILNGNWTIQHNLPIGVCAFSMYLGIYIMFTKNWKVFEIGYFWAIGGVLSVVFPDILYGPDNFRYYNFLFLHMIFFFMYMYMMFVHDYVPTFKSFKKSFLLLLAIVLVFIVPVNLIFGTNFMYLLEPGDTPFVIFANPSYPLYLIGCILLSMAGMALWYSPVAIYNKIKAKK
ncbi:MAG: TIGR02206 family membrane protein [Candidatus Izimaplasma sp.]|nr:TIGR02206 family membrane protein [Candidatus Izimaplasma bacterium]